MKFDFNETNLLRQNLFSPHDSKTILIHRLTNLTTTTNDLILKDSLFSLIKKLESLSELQIKQLYDDKINKKLIATANYDYPSSSSSKHN